MSDLGIKVLIESIGAILIGISVVILLGWIIGVGVSALKHKTIMRAQVDLHKRILEKFDSVAGFTDYLQSEAGRRFFDGLAVDAPRPERKLLDSVQKGVIISVLGLSLLLLKMLFYSVDEGIFLIIGVIVLALGLGFLISAAVTYRLSKAWGLLDGENVHAKTLSAESGEAETRISSLGTPASFRRKSQS